MLLKFAWLSSPGLLSKTVYPATVTHLIANLDRRRKTSLMRPPTLCYLPLSQTVIASQKFGWVNTMNWTLANFTESEAPNVTMETLLLVPVARETHRNWKRYTLKVYCSWATCLVVARWLHICSAKQSRDVYGNSRDDPSRLLLITPVFFVERTGHWVDRR